jgi:hypothetical protein
MLTLADCLAILAFEAALDRNPWLWSQLARLEEWPSLKPCAPDPSKHLIRIEQSDLGKTK